MGFNSGFKGLMEYLFATFTGFHSSVAEDSGLLGCDTVLLS